MSKIATKADLAKELLRRRAAREHLLDFTAYTKPDWQTGDHHRVICDALEAVERGDCRRLIIEAPPRHTKSELASRRFPAWFLGRSPHKQVITISYGDELAKDFSRDVRGTFNSQEFKALFPDVSLSADTRAIGRWSTNKGGAYVCAGVGGPVTGRGAHVALIDDPLKNREAADSLPTRNRVWKFYTSTLYSRLMPKSQGGAVIVIMTRWHEDDLVGRLLEVDDWDRVSLPAIKNEGTENEEALWPEWMPIEELQEKREMYFAAGQARDWHALYQQEPTNELGTYCKREWFENRYTRHPPRKEMNVYLASDFAVTDASEGRDPDFTEHGVFGVDQDGTIYVLDWWFGRTDADVWIDSRLDLVEKWRPNLCIGEAGQIRRAIKPFYEKRKKERRVWSRDEWVNPGTRDKAVRGRAFQAMLSMGMLLFPQYSAWADRVIENCVGFPGATHDDAFDVCSLLCLALEEIRPGRKEVQPEPKRRDRWAEEGESTDDWRVA